MKEVKKLMIKINSKKHSMNSSRRRKVTLEHWKTLNKVLDVLDLNSVMMSFGRCNQVDGDEDSNYSPAGREGWKYCMDCQCFDMWENLTPDYHYFELTLPCSEVSECIQYCV